MRHPYASTLELLMIAVAKLPPGFPEEDRQRFHAAFEAFLKAGDKAVYGDIHRTIVDLGERSWAHRRAYQELYDRYGRASEEANLLKHLDRGVREKYETFIHEGGKIGHVEQVSVRTIEELRSPSPFERYFSPEEKFAITQSLLTARDDARMEIDGLVAGPKREEFEMLVRAFRIEQEGMKEKLRELVALADISPRWRADIQNRVIAIEDGWSVLEKPYTPQDLDREVEYWKGTLASFLHA